MSESMHPDPKTIFEAFLSGISDDTIATVWSRQQLRRRGGIGQLQSEVKSSMEKRGYVHLRTVGSIGGVGLMPVAYFEYPDCEVYKVVQFGTEDVPRYLVLRPDDTQHGELLSFLINQARTIDVRSDIL
ncbi:hypothetical protein HY218_00840 [Candidatus Saccharibacteria bacterium]|nr:hypothetical protein [Candidatus Saccharibacteria bacterium]